MDEIKDLTKIIPPKSFEKVRRLRKGNSYKVEELYEGLVNDQFQNDEEARNYFYNGKSSYKNFASLKYSLREMLLNAYFLLPKPTENERLKSVRDECYRNLAIIKSLIAKGNRNISTRISELTLKKCRKYQIHDVSYLLAEELVMYYATIGDHRRMNDYQELCRDLTKILEAERELWFITAEIFAHSSTRNQLKESLKAELVEKAYKTVDRFKDLNSYKINLYRHNVLMMAAHFKGDSQAIIEQGEAALKYFESLNFEPTKTAYFMIYLKLLPVYILQKDKEKAGKIIERCINLSNKGSYNWNVALLYQAIYGFHFKSFDLAKSAYYQAIKHNKPENLSEQWKIIGAYLHFLSRIKKIDHVAKFRLGKFLNEVPIYEKDKMGANVSILVMQILILLSKGQKGKIIDRISSLKAYEFTYLRNDHTFRSNCFIKILTKLPEANFHKVAFQRKTKALVVKLNSRPMSLGDIEVELIPYEDLYDFLMEML